MNNKDFISALSKRTGYKNVDVQHMVRTAVNAITDNLLDEGAVSLSRLGTFDVKKRNERIINNPSTGQRMLVPPKLVVNFKPVSSAKEKMNTSTIDD